MAVFEKFRARGMFGKLHGIMQWSRIPAVPNRAACSAELDDGQIIPAPL
ncbi:hypothetical protein [Phaeovulum sp. NW3]|nr:hypothetical protein [Phaeovulum sp. NW3]